MQQTGDRRTSPAYVEKLTLYFTPNGYVVVDMGNTRFNATLEEIARLIEHKVLHQELYEVFAGRVEQPV